ncbi:hypothetical protein K435DRAFT_939512 [Dendrothele bispora CBS 962.96]|uniref:Uncharacterized protein n=1 Tax=Dendrothele bispora (strain CBS 962.96) TaxID=1314807 RepID=A0A4S8KXK5_DENBC|nr:hypothetical protein K435DRAFT_939512 [Dendrothele bispora CBS 962.96]
MYLKIFIQVFPDSFQLYTGMGKFAGTPCGLAGTFLEFAGILRFSMNIRLKKLKMGLATHCNKGYNSYKNDFAKLFKEIICGDLAQTLAGTAWQGSKFTGTLLRPSQILGKYPDLKAYEVVPPILYLCLNITGEN